MADNTVLDPGACGDTIATDCISCVKHQRVKIEWGADGSANCVTACGPLPAALYSGGAAIGLSHTDLDSGAGTANNLVVALGVAAAGGAAVITGDVTNGLDVDVTRVGGTVTVGNAGTFATQVDGAALTALQLIDDTVYADDADWTDGSSKHLLVGGLYQSSPQTVTDGDVGPFLITANGRLQVDASSAAVPITDNCGTITVDGTVTANLSATDNTVLDNIQTAVEVIDNSVVVLGTATYTEATSSGTIVGAVRNDALAALANTDNEIAPLQVTAEGALWGTNAATADTSAGVSVHNCIDVDETEVAVKASAGNLYGYYFHNVDACTVHYLKYWNAAPACVTVGGCSGTAPLVTFPLPKGAAGHISICPPIAFSTAITVGAVTGVGDCSSTGPGANEVQVVSFYK